MQLLPQSLVGAPDDHLVLRALVNSAASIAVSLGIVGAVTAATRALGLNWESQEPLVLSVADAPLIVLVAPLLETLLLTAALSVLARTRLSQVQIALVAASAWGAAHIPRDAISFFGTFPGFFIDSAAFLVWRERSYLHGFAAAALQHGVQNACALAAAIFMAGR